MGSLNFGQLMEEAKKAGGFEAVPDGLYIAKVANATAVQASSGKPMIKTQFKIIAGPHANQTVFTQFVLSADNPNALGFFFRHMRALGLDENFFKAEPEMAQIADAIRDRVVQIKVGSHVYQGERRNDVDGIAPAPPGYEQNGPAPAPPAADPFRAPPTATAPLPAPGPPTPAPGAGQEPAPASPFPEPPF